MHLRFSQCISVFYLKEKKISGLQTRWFLINGLTLRKGLSKTVNHHYDPVFKIKITNYVFFPLQFSLKLLLNIIFLKFFSNTV